MKELISVIVPVHNAEKYLVDCIESIVEQSYKNLEIILVNDCSSDNSANICDSYAERDRRIRVIHRKEKGGEGGAKARNHGIAEAKGEILYFMDSDDYIEEDMLWNMHQIMQKENSQCVVTSFHYVDAEGKELAWRVPQINEYQCMSGKEAARIFLTTRDIEGFSWNKLIRRELIDSKGICFDESMNSFVDMYNMFKTVLYSDKVSFYHGRPYYYRQHNVSCVHTMNKRKLDNFKRVNEQIFKLASENNLVEEAEFFYRYRMILQLYDAIKMRKGYTKDVWGKIIEEYGWNKIFDVSVLKISKSLVMTIKEDKLKNIFKIFCVRLFF